MKKFKKKKLNNNIDNETVTSFGNEWNAFQQDQLEKKELEKIFLNYFSIFPLDSINKNSIGFDMGCGSGRWAYFIAPKVKILYCIEPSEKALNIAKKNLVNTTNCIFLNANANNFNIENDSMDFGYSLGVLHHIPDTLSALKNCIRKLKPGAPFLIYLYYNFDNKGLTYYAIWFLSNILRQLISRLPFFLKKIITDCITFIIYLPLAKLSYLLNKLGFKNISLPLSFYKDKSLYTMRTDSLDRFGTKLEKRFSKNQIKTLMEKSNLKDIQFFSSEPYWIALGYKRK